MASEIRHNIPYGALLKKGRSREKRTKARDRRSGMSRAHLDRVRMLPCCICGRPATEDAPNDPHHLKEGTGERGSGLRSTDQYAVPLCGFPYGQDCHGTVEAVGSKNEKQWFLDKGIDAMALAMDLYRSTDNPDKMMRLVFDAAMKIP